MPAPLSFRPFQRALAVALLLALAAPSDARAQGLPVQLRMSTGSFLYSDAQSLVEVYLSLGAESLVYASTPEGFSTDIAVDVALVPASAAAPEGAAASAVASERIERRYVVADTAALTPGQVFVEQVRLAVPPGEYQVVATILGGTAPGAGVVEARVDLDVPAYGGGAGTRMSSIELLTGGERSSDDTDPFVKSGFRLIPNPDAFYGADRPTLPVYFEVYDPPSDSYTLLTYLTEGSGEAPLPGTEQRTTRRSQAVDVVLTQRSVAELPSGLYYLRAAVLDEANEAAAQSAVRFFVINPDVQRSDVLATDLSAEEATYAVMGEEELTSNLRHARVLASEREKSQIAALLEDGADDVARRAFLVRFWQERDTDPRPTINGERRDFYQRLAEVNSRFGRGSREGFETDRGRVYLTYGVPSQVDRRSNDQNTLPYEIWLYDQIAGSGRAIFVFVDRFSTGEPELIHSTVRGEVSLPDWEREITIR